MCFSNLGQVVGSAIANEQQKQVEDAIPPATPKGGLKRREDAGLGLLYNLYKGEKRMTNTIRVVR